jgi:hypothetical protein
MFLVIVPEEKKMSSVNREKAMQIFADRREGHYNTHDTRDEALVSIRDMMKTPTDKVITLVHSIGRFNVYDTNEFLVQVKDWKKKRVVILKCNIFEVDCEELGKMWLFTVTPPGKKCVNLCPLALAFNIMVSGYSYISADRDLIDLAWRYLGSHE